MGDINFVGIAASLLSNAPRLVREWLPNGKLEGKEWCVGNIKGDKGRSFKVNIEKGTWADFAGSVKGGDLISLYANLHDIDNVKAAKILSGTPVANDYVKSVEEDNEPIELVPEGKKPPRNPNFTKEWAYHNAEGKIIGYVHRYDIGENKQFYPFRWVNGKWRQKGFPRPRPLYNLHDLIRRPTDPVIIVEGEKCADIGKSFFHSYVTTTWPNGAVSHALADWSPMLTHKHFILIPDNDDRGIEAMIAVGHKLRSMGLHDVNIVDVTSRPPKWDIADAETDGTADLFGWIKRHKYDFDSFLKLRSDDLKTPLKADPNFDPIGAEPDDGVTAFSDNSVARNAYFRILGISGEQYWFYKYKTSQIIGMGPEILGKEGSLVALAPKEWWEECFQGKWNMARSALIRIAENFRYDPRDNRQIGAWVDPSGNVIHLGDKLLSRDGFVELKDFNTDYIYEYCPSAIRIGSFQPVLPVKRSKVIVEICNGANWAQPNSGRVLAGWLFASLMCGSMRWRSHIYITGPAGSGKTWLLDNIVSGVLGDFRFKAVGSSTEPSIRQGLNNNRIPVIFDECEANNAQVMNRLSAIFELSRQASSSDEDSAIVKGSSSGKTVSYHVQSSFLFASINPTMTEYADQTRTTILSLLKNIKNDESRVRLRQIEKLVKENLTQEFRSALLTRAVYYLADARRAFEIFSEAAYQTIAIDVRNAEQQAFMMTGLWFLENDRMPTLAEAKLVAETFRADENSVPTIISTEERLVSSISQSKVRVKVPNGYEDRILGELIRDAHLETMGDSKQVIMRMGLKVHKGRLYVANSSDNLKRILRETHFHSGWERTIINIEGARVEKNVDFSAGMFGAAVSIPLEVVLGAKYKDVDSDTVVI